VTCMIAFSFEDNSIVELLVPGDEDYNHLTSQSSHLHYDKDYSCLLLHDYACLMRVHMPKVNFTNMNISIRELFDHLILDMSQI
jgi:hypothetical protein